MTDNQKNDENLFSKSKLKGIIIISLASIVVSVLIGLFVYKFTSGYFEKMAMVKRNSGSKKNIEIVLPDGSKVWLNSNSQIRYPKEFGPNIREVFFEGEAFFAVVKNEEKPFMLYSINSRVEVVGTTFNIRAYPNEKELILSVASGEVILFDNESDKNAIQIQNGEQGMFNYDSRKISRNRNQDINYLSWQTGKFFFKNTPLSEVAKKLIKYYEKQIVFENETLKKCRISLDIDNKKLLEVMEDIKKLIPIDIEQANEKIIIHGKGC